MSVGIIGAGPGGLSLGILLSRAGFRDFTIFDREEEVDRWMVGTVWTAQCSNYFRAANGRVVTQWPRSARTFWGMTRRFKSADFSFQAPAVSAIDMGVARASSVSGSQRR